MVVGLAKRLEEVFVPTSQLPLFIPKTSASLRLLQQVRDEAHRFAITYHRKLREKRTLHTELLDIPGVGKVSSTNMLRHFGSVDAIRNADRQSIAEVVGPSIAERVIRHFHGLGADENAQS